MPTNLRLAPSTIMPTLRYHNAPAAIEWLCQVFGFERHAVYPGPEGTIAHAELTLRGGMIMLGSHKHDGHGQGFRSLEEVGDYETRSAYVVVTEIDAVYERAKAAGGSVIRELQGTDYGSRDFSIKDLEGHSWSVGTYDPWKTPSE